MSAREAMNTLTLDNAREIVASIQREFCELTDDLLVDERRYYSRVGREWEFRAAEIPAGRIPVKVGSRYRSALQMHFVAAIESVWEFWKPRRPLLAAALQQMRCHRVGVRPSAVELTVPGHLLYFDTICVPDYATAAFSPLALEKFDLRQLAPFLDWLMAVRELTPAIRSDADFPAVVICPTDPSGRPMPDTSAERLAARLLADAFGVAPSDSLALLVERLRLKSDRELTSTADFCLLRRFFGYDAGLDLLDIAEVGSSAHPVALVGVVLKHQCVARGAIWPLALAAKSVFLDLYSNEMTATEYGFSPSVSDVEWESYRFRASVVENEWRVRQPMGPDAGLSRVFTMSALGGSAISIGAALRVREAPRVERVRDIVRTYEFRLHSATVDEFGTAAAEFSKELRSAIHTARLRETTAIDSATARLKRAASMFGASASLTVLCFARPQMASLAAASAGISLLWGAPSVRDLIRAKRSRDHLQSEAHLSPLTLLLKATKPR